MLVLRTRTCQNASTMSKFLLRRLGVADDPGSYRPGLQGCLEAVLEQSDTLMDDVLAGLKASLSPAKSKSRPVSESANLVAKKTIDTLMANRVEVKAAFSRALRAAVFGGDTQRKASWT